MAACPVSIPSVSVRRRPLALTQRRLEANRRNAARSTGPRTLEGKARVARNPIKHGFFVAAERWAPQQQRDFKETLDGLRDDLKPQSALEESCLLTMAQSYVRMAAILSYENIAALEYHQRREREMNERIAAADAAEAARLRAQRDKLRRAGLWRPTIPGPREAKAIIRYSGSLDRTIRRAASDLEGMRNLRTGGASSKAKVQKQTHCSTTLSSVLSAARRTSNGTTRIAELQKQTHYPAPPGNGPEAAEGPQVAIPSEAEHAKTNPLSSMFTGNRHERRRARALAKRELRRQPV